MRLKSLLLVTIVYVIAMMLFWSLCFAIFNIHHNQKLSTRSPSQMQVQSSKLLGILVWSDNVWETSACPSCWIRGEKKEKLTDLENRGIRAVVFPFTELYDIEEIKAFPRTPNHLFVLANLEPPPLSAFEEFFQTDFFNLTMTYSLRSDIFSPFGNFKSRRNDLIVQPSNSTQWMPVNDTWTRRDIRLLKHLTTKTSHCIWIVSNCKTFSKRELLVRELQKYIPVDTYGKCSGRMDLSGNWHQNYKFFLSFENALCEDYISEKVYAYMAYHIVPVVFGGANYSNFVPPHSYIDAQQFATVSELADYLNELARDPYEYVKYFWWRRFYKVETTDYGGAESLCKLCNYLQTQSYPPLSRTVDMDKFWPPNICYYQAKILFTNSTANTSNISNTSNTLNIANTSNTITEHASPIDGSYQVEGPIDRLPNGNTGNLNHPNSTLK